MKSNDENICLLNYWWAANYGANLTAYALYNLLLLENKIPLMVKNEDELQLMHEQESTFNKNFAKNFFKTTDTHNSFSSLSSLNKISKTFIVGSDQVFRSVLSKQCLNSRLLDFTDIDAKRIAFSASFGGDKKQFINETSPEVIEKMKMALQTFSFVSVREKAGVEICKDVFNIDAKLIIDPVFIIDKEKYSELIASTATHCYNEKVISFLFHQTINNYKGEKVWSIHQKDISIGEWLKAIRDCKLLITDSFHAMCFAIIFNKPFIVFVNQDTGISRYETILEILGIENQCIYSKDELKRRDCVFKIDYNRVNEKIKEEAEKGKSFLRTAIATEITVTPQMMKSREMFLRYIIIEKEKELNLKFQITKALWYAWVNCFHRYLPESIKNVIRTMRSVIRCKL